MAVKRTRTLKLADAETRESPAFVYGFLAGQPWELDSGSLVQIGPRVTSKWTSDSPKIGFDHAHA